MQRGNDGDVPVEKGNYLSTSNCSCMRCVLHEFAEKGDTVAIFWANHSRWQLSAQENVDYYLEKTFLTNKKCLPVKVGLTS